MIIRIKQGRIFLFNSFKSAMIGVVSFLFSTATFANPVLNNVASGQVAVTQTNNSTVVNQTSQKAILNWDSFNIGAGETTHFQQPEGGIALNRINPAQGVSQIYGHLTATGQIILVNPAGIFFGPGAYVNVGGLIASTANISDTDFLNGHYYFYKDGNYNGAIINQGQIIAAQNGLIALIGGAVSNEGLISANAGHVALGAGDTFTLSFDNDNLINFAIGQGVSTRAHDQNGNEMTDGVKNTGSIIVNGGQVVISARDAANVLTNVVNLDGVTQVRSVTQDGGTLVISGDASNGVVNIAGNIDASSSVGKGGNINIIGYNILLTDTANLNVNGYLGGGNINIGGNAHGTGTLPNANAVVMAPGAQLHADALNSSDGGNIVLWSDYYTNVNGLISARGGETSGNGGFVETSSQNLLNVGGLSVDTSAPNGTIGTWLLDPWNVTISASATSNGTFSGASPNVFTPTATGATVLNTDIQTNLATANVTITTGATGAEAGNITVSAPITWASANTLYLNAAGNIVINSAISGTSGSLNLTAQNAAQSITTGAGGTISVANFNLLQGQWYQNTASLPTFTVTNNFQINSGTIPNATTQFIRATGGTGAAGSPYTITDVFGLQGIMSTTTTLANSFTMASNIDATVTQFWNGGAGFVPIGNATNAYTGNFNGGNFIINNLYINRAQSNVGLFGYTTSGGTNTITNVGLTNINYTTSGTISNVGGLVGSQFNTDISNSYATGSIHANGQTTNLGGLVGNMNGGSHQIFNSYADVNITAANNSINIGGFVGGVASNLVYQNYSAGSITVNGGGTNVGGFAGESGAGGALTTLYRNYSITPITITATGTQVGGFIGFQYNNATTTNSYASGAISIGGSKVSVGGFIGKLNTAGVQVTNSLWDIGTTGISAGYGTNSSGTVTALYGGCFGNTTCGTASNATNTTPVNLALLASYTGAGWSSTAGAAGSITTTASTTSTAPNYTWFIFDGFTRPMLLSEYKTTIKNAHQLQMVGSTLGGSYTLANNIDFSTITRTADIWGSNFNTSTGTGFISIGGYAASTTTPGTNFTGTFNGNNFTINKLYINAATNQRNFLGLFGSASGATISNLGLTNINIVANNATSGNAFVGGVVGAMISTSLSNVYVTGTIAGGITQSGNMSVLTGGTSDAGDYVGGLVGYAGGTVGTASTINNAYSTATVSGKRLIGGLLGKGYNYTNITNSFSSGTVSTAANSGSAIGGLVGALDTSTATIATSYSNNTVTTAANTGTQDVGGLVGYFNGAITNAYSSSLVTSSSGTTNLGGLIGNAAGGTVTNAYSSGYIVNTGGSNTGGLIGTNSATVANSFWNIDLTGQASSSGSTGAAGYRGMTMTQMMTAANYTNTANGFVTATNAWDTSTIWNIIDGQSFPYLRSFYSSTPQIISGTSSATANSNLTYALNGVATGTITTSANGNFYKLFGSNLRDGTNTYLTNSVLFTVYQAGSTSVGNVITILPSSNGSLSGTTGLTLTANSVTAGNAGTSPALSNSQLKSGYVSGETAMLFSVDASNNLTVNSGKNYITTSGTTYSIDGNINMVNGTLTMSGPVSITAANPTLTITGVSSIGGAISGNGFTKAGSSSLTLNVANSYSGNTTLSSGTLIANDNASLSTSTLHMAGGTFQVGTSGLNIANNVVLDAAGIFGGTNDFTLSGIISGANTVTKNGSSALTLSGINTYSLGTTLASGTLIVNNNSAIGSGALDMTGGTLQAGTAGLNIANNITLDAASIFAGSFDFTLSGIISGANGFTKNGSSTLTLTGNNTYSGGTTLSSGTLVANINTALGTGSLHLAGGTFQTGTAGLTIANIITLDSPSILTGGFDYTLSGIISSTSSFTKNGSNSITLTGINTYSGGTTLANGTLVVNTNTALGTGTLDITGGTLLIGTNGLSIANNIIFDTSVTFGGSNNFTLSGIISGANSLTKNGSSTLTLSGNNTYSGGTTLASGTLSVNANTALGTGTLDITGGTLQIGTNGLSIANNIIFDTAVTLGGSNNFTLSGIISGANSLTKNGTSALTLSGNNTYSGGTTLANGTLTVNADTALGTGTLDITSGSFQVGTSGLNIANNIIFDTAVTLGGSNNFTLSGIISGANSLTKNGSSTLTLSGNNTYSGGTTLASGTIAVNANTSLGTGTLDITGGTLQIGTNGLSIANNIIFDTAVTLGGSNNLTLSGIISGANSLTKNGTSTLTLSGNNTYSGGTTLAGGTLILSHATNAIGTGSLSLNGGTLTVSQNTTLANNFSIGGNTIINSNNDMTFNGTGTLGTGTILTKNGSGAITFGNTVIGDGDLTINAGTFTLAGNNTGVNAANSYAGLSTINNGGILNITNAGGLGFSSVWAQGGTSDATAGGTVSGGVFQINNVNITTGNSVTLNNGVMNTIGTLTFNGAITVSNSSASVYNILQTNGSLTMNSNINSDAGNTGNLRTEGTGTWNMNGDIGHVNALNNIVNNLTTVLGSTNVQTTGSQTYNGAVTANNATTLTVGSNGNLAFNNGLTGTGAITVNGATGTNTLTINATSGTPTWNIGDNSGSIQGLTSSFRFNDFENLISSNNGNTFVFLNNAHMNSIVAGSASNAALNTFDFSNNTGAANVMFGTDIFDGSVTLGGNNVVDAYSNVNKLIGNAGTSNVIHLPSGKNAYVVFNAGSSYSGYIGDPTYFFNFSVAGVVPPSPPSPTTVTPQTVLPGSVTTILFVVNNAVDYNGTTTLAPTLIPAIQYSILSLDASNEIDIANLNIPNTLLNRTINQPLIPAGLNMRVDFPASRLR